MQTLLAPSRSRTLRRPGPLRLALLGLLAACGAEPPVDPGAVPISCPSEGWCWQRGRPLTVDGDRARGTVYALGAEGMFLRWQGDRFVAARAPTPRTLLSAWLRSPDDAWVSDDEGKSWRLDGASWREVPGPAPIHRILGAPDGSLWAKAGGSASAHGGTSAARLVREQGGRWVEAMQPFPYCIGGDFTITPQGQIWSAGLVCNPAGTVDGLEVHRFDGAGWQRVGERIAGQAWFPSFVPGTGRVRVRALRTYEWDGAGWLPVDPPPVPPTLPADQQALWDGLGVTIAPSSLGCEGAYRPDERHVFCFGYGQIYRQVGTGWQATLTDAFEETQAAESWGRVPPALWAGGHVLRAWGSGPADVYRVRLESGSRLEHFDGAAWAVALDAAVVDVAGAGRGEVWALTPDGLHRSDGRGFVAVPVPAELEAWPKETGPLSGAVDANGDIWGRGALDMKGMGVVEAMTLVWLKRANVPLNRDVILLAVGDEEVDNLGMKHLVENHWSRLDCAELVNEGGLGVKNLLFEGQTVFAVSVAEKGALWLRMKASGEAGHGSTPVPQRAPTRLIEAMKAISGRQPAPQIHAALYELLRRIGEQKGGVTGFIGANASAMVPVAVCSALIRVCFPEGSTAIASPGRSTPEASVAQKPRKSRFGRSTSCTGRRRSTRLRSLATCTFSRCSSSVWPWYHGMLSPRCTTFSPSSADRGRKWMSRTCSRVANSA